VFLEKSVDLVKLVWVAFSLMELLYLLC